MAFAELGIDVAFSGEGISEKASIVKCNNPAYQVPEGKIVVEVDPAYFRPTEVELLIGNPEKANKVLGWYPEYDLKGLVADMMQSDVKLMQKDKYLKDGGYRIMNYFE
jgi:GDPmannose 4,6-dehydratase